jgi:hypothetical protein
MKSNKQFDLAFGGFFMGEGMIRISLDKRKGGNRFSRNYGEVLKPWYRQVARITLRQDDEQILDLIKSKIGGHVFRRGIRNKVWNKQRGLYTWSHPITIWQAEDLETCEKVCKILLANPLPSKKKEEAKIFIEYISLKKKKYKRGIGYSEDILQKFEWYHQKLKELKKFKEK